MNEFTEKFKELKNLPVRLYVVFVKEGSAYPVTVSSSGRSVVIWDEPLKAAQWEYWKEILKKGTNYTYDYRNGKLWISQQQL